jgi:DNA-binding transcriptional LysR family regulator
MQIFHGWVQTRNLATLLQVVRLGGIGAAARQLNLTQPAVSRRIDELERELGTPLFRRQGRQVVPTPAARLCLASAERILAEVEVMRGLASGRGVAQRSVRIGVAELVALTWFDRLLARLRETHPHVVVDMHVDLASRLVDGLSRRALDLILTPGEVPIGGVLRRDIGASTYAWMGTPARMIGRDHLAPADLLDLPVLMAPQGSDSHRMVMDWCEAAGVAPARFSFCNNLGVLGTMVRKGVGVSPLPVELFAAELAEGALVALPSRPPMRSIAYSACHLPSRDAALMQEIADLAHAESWFSKPGVPG